MRAHVGPLARADAQHWRGTALVCQRHAALRVTLRRHARGSHSRGTGARTKDTGEHARYLIQLCDVMAA